MGTKSWEVEGMGTQKLFPHISNKTQGRSLIWSI